MATLGDRMKLLRKEKAISQKELAVNIEFAQPTIAKWELGKGEPSILGLSKMAEYFGVSVDYLIGISDERPSDSPWKKREDMIEVAPFEKQVLLNYRMLPPSEQVMVCRMLQLEHPATSRDKMKKA